GFVDENGFRSIAMVHIKIVHGDSFSSCRQRLEQCNRDIAQITKSHSAIACGMVSGRAHQAERALAGARRLQSFKAGADRSPAISRDVWKIGCVSVEVPRLFQSREMFRSVSAQQYRVVKRRGLAPFDRPLGW